MARRAILAGAIMRSGYGHRSRSMRRLAIFFSQQTSWRTRYERQLSGS
nr:hypothetical protein [Bradyrhizobium sp.]